MSIDKTASITSMGDDQLPTLNGILENIQSQALSAKNTSILPTIKTVPEGQVVIYDDGAGTKRLYVVTAKKNLGYVNLS
jgi:hypothetical protein